MEQCTYKIYVEESLEKQCFPLLQRNLKTPFVFFRLVLILLYDIMLTKVSVPPVLQLFSPKESHKCLH